MSTSGKAAGANQGDDESPRERPQWRRRRRLPPEERRNSLLDAAAAVIIENGFDHLTMETITDRAGVSKALGYFYFNRLEELLHELFTREFEAIYERLVPALTSEGTLEERIRAKVAAYFDVVGERRDLFFQLNTHLHGPEYRRERQERFRRWENYVADLVRADFAVPDMYAPLISRLLMVVDDRCVNIWLRDGLPRNEVEELCVQFQLAGLHQVLDGGNGELSLSVRTREAVESEARSSLPREKKSAKLSPQTEAGDSDGSAASKRRKKSTSSVRDKESG